MPAVVQAMSKLNPTQRILGETFLPVARGYVGFAVRTVTAEFLVSEILAEARRLLADQYDDESMSHGKQIGRLADMPHLPVEKVASNSAAERRLEKIIAYLEGLEQKGEQFISLDPTQDWEFQILNRADKNSSPSSPLQTDELQATAG